MISITDEAAIQAANGLSIAIIRINKDIGTARYQGGLDITLDELIEAYVYIHRKVDEVYPGSRVTNDELAKIINDRRLK